MGRGNVCTYGEFEGLYYVDRDYFQVNAINEETGEELNKIDYDASDEVEREKMEEFILRFARRFPSFCRCDKWIDCGTKFAVLESKLFYICFEDNEWSVAVELVQKQANDSQWPAMQRRHYDSYLKGIREILLDMFPTIRGYTGPWTSSLVQREEVVS